MVKHPNLSPTRQQDLLTNGTREQVIAWLTWNDANGIYTDEQAADEGMPPLTLEQARDLMRGQIEE